MLNTLCTWDKQLQKYCFQVMILYISELIWNNYSYVITVNNVLHLLVSFISTLKIIHSHHKFQIFDIMSQLGKYLSSPLFSVDYQLLGIAKKIFPLVLC